MERRPPRSTRTCTLFPTRRSSDLIGEVDDERDLAIGLGAHFELEQHFVDLVADLVGADVELDVDLRLRARRTLEDAWGVRILERQILDVLDRKSTRLNSSH